jgi:beta-lactamase class A
VQGAGLSWLLRSRRLPYQDVLLLMVTLSDNLCANLVIQRIGLARLNAIFQQESGLAGTEINRKLMDFEARSRGLDNWITAADAIHLFDLVHNLSPVEKAWIEPILLANQSDNFLKRDIPVDSLDFFHKTGAISGVLHDWGYTRRCDIFLFMQQVKDVPAALRVFGELGKLMAAS